MAPHLNTSAVAVKHEPDSPPAQQQQSNTSLNRSSTASKRNSSRHNASVNIEQTTAEANAAVIQAAQFRHRKAIEELLAKRSDLRLVDTAEQPASMSGAAEPLGPDDEVWLFECARGVPVESLLGAKLSLTGARKTVRLGDEGVEYQSEEMAAARTHSMVCRRRGSRRHELVSFKPVGTVRLHKEVQELLVADIVQPKRKLVPYPTDLKVRHPLHGNDYTKHTNLPVEVQSKLRSAVRASRAAATENVDGTSAADTAATVAVSVKQEKPTKSAKKRKATAPVVEEPASGGEEEVAAPKKAKRVKREKEPVKPEPTADDDELGANLDWLSAI